MNAHHNLKKEQQPIWSLKGFGIASCFKSSPIPLNIPQMSHSYFAVVRYKYTHPQLHWQRHTYSAHPSKYIPTESKQCTAYIGNCLAGFEMFIPFGCSQFHLVVVFYSIHESVWTRTLWELCSSSKPSIQQIGFSLLLRCIWILVWINSSSYWKVYMCLIY